MRELARKAVHNRLSALTTSGLTIQDRAGQHEFGDPHASDLRAQLRIRDHDVYARMLLDGTLGAGAAYMDGLWESDDLCSVIRVFARHRQQLSTVDSGLARLGAWLNRAVHTLRRNTLRGSRRNIQAHYDLGNEFFGLFLDRTWTYSAGLFTRPDATLEEAQLAKYERICRKLELSESDHVMEIGGGWGGFALYAAEHYGCHVTSTTISPAQLKLAEQRAKEANLTDRVRFVSLDYRDLEGSYDKLVSIEMIEAVGHPYLKSYFKVCSDLLQPDGRALIQAITVPDRYYDQARRTTDFIKRFIFPGGHLPSIEIMQRSVAAVTDFRTLHLEDLSDHYARTLRLWRERFLAERKRVLEQGFSESFIRMWEFYLAYCEGAFLERSIGLVQMLLEKPRGRCDLGLIDSGGGTA